VVHRDVKPGNVLLTQSDTVKVTDFGIARAGASDGLTQTGSVMGTATYFSPEQAQGLPVDGRSDVYALGVVLYEMVTGVAPFTGDSPVSVAYKHVREDVVLPSERNPDVPPDLERIIMTALAKTPENRYQTADEMRADILRFRRGRPVVGTPAGALAEVPTGSTATVIGAPVAAAAAYGASTVMTPRVDERGRVTGGTPVSRQRRNTALVWILTLLGLAAVVGAILFAAIKLGGAQASVTVPDERTKPVAVAQQDLQKAHLKPDIRREASSTVPVDIVVRQDPPAGKSVSRGSNVTLFVSAGAARKAIPTDITGRPAAEVTAELQGLGFVVASKDQANAAAKGTVFTSIPNPGTQADVGSTVTIIVSSGPAPVAVTDVKGLSFDQASQALEQQGFTNLSPPIQETSNTVASGSVTRTDPPAAKPVPIDTRINIYVSTGAPKVTLPSEIGKSEADAKADLISKGFTVSTLNQVDNANIGKVVAQNPDQATQVPQNSNVVLTIGIAGETTTTGPSDTTTTTGP
jgi:beta-lactam-binding protein with PASTA domain